MIYLNINLLKFAFESPINLNVFLFQCAFTGICCQRGRGGSRGGISEVINDQAKTEAPWVKNVAQFTNVNV